jgi:DNA-binding transcriptional LysR family regulator
MLRFMVDVELRHLRTMAAIVEEGTFGRAASRLGYTQSSVSQQIAALEKAVGGAVFDRPGGPRPVRITPLGEVVSAHGRDLLTKAEALADAVDRFRAGNGRIDIGTFQGVSKLILPTVVRRLLGEHRRIRKSEISTCCSTTAGSAATSSTSSCSTSRTSWWPALMHSPMVQYG